MAALVAASERRTDSERQDCRNVARGRRRRLRDATARRYTPPNVLVIVLDQLRYDALGFVQASLPLYQGKLKIRTPNIDRLASLGASFTNAYCQSPSCGPARSSIKTGCTVKRNGVTSNPLVDEDAYNKMTSYRDRVNAMVTFEQLLVEHLNYTAESYGKWHNPYRLVRSTDNSSNVIRYNDYNYETATPELHLMQSFKPAYRRALQYLRESDGLPIDNVQVEYQRHQQPSTWSQLPYEPIQLDPRYQSPPGTALSTKNGFSKFLVGNSNVYGRDLLDPKYTSTGILGKMGLDALNRMIDEGIRSNSSRPFCLGVHFNSPHPPYLATSEYLDHYYENRDQLLVSPSLYDPMTGSAYAFENNRAYKSELGDAYRFDDPEAMAELVAVYYASIEEVDHWVGLLVDAVYENNLQDETLIVFASDHGEMLGAHGMLGKGVLLEEAVRVPLILSFPPHIPKGLQVSEAVSTMDLHATILDYVGAPPSLDRSDGSSLRRHVQKTSYNAAYDETVVVVEYYTRKPKDEHSFRGSVGEVPNFMIRKGSYKLIVPRMHDSPVPDMMYDLSKDPFELDNLLQRPDADLDDVSIGKAEHLKALLGEWLERNDKDDRIYSSPSYDLGEGLGDVRELAKRRTWRPLEYWQSDTELLFGTPSLLDKKHRHAYARVEYFYIGRSSPSSETDREAALVLENVTVEGDDAKLFRVQASRPRQRPRGGGGGNSGSSILRIRVSFESSERVDDRPLDARLVVQTNVRGRVEIPIRWDRSHHESEVEGESNHVAK